MSKNWVAGGLGCLGGAIAGFTIGVFSISLIFVTNIESLHAQLVPDAAVFNASISPTAGDPDLTGALETIRNGQRVPAIAATMVNADGSTRTAVAGVRKLGMDIPAEVGDRWHMGSNTKAMTATLAGSYVEEGIIDWDTRAGDVFTNLEPAGKYFLGDATLRQLLTHHGGVEGNLNWWAFDGIGTPTQQRAAVVLRANDASMESEPGSKRSYANLGFVIAAAMLEKASGEAWEDAMRARIFEPLGMTSAGFGGTGTPGEVDQPWPHSEDGTPRRSNGPKEDNPPVMGPAGTVHCSMEDWAKFAADQLRGARGEKALLKQETYKVLHTPYEGSDSAMGWRVLERPWGGGAVLHHTGSNTMNYANVWVAPARGIAYLACTNTGKDNAFEATNDAIVALIQVSGYLSE